MCVCVRACVRVCVTKFFVTLLCVCAKAICDGVVLCVCVCDRVVCACDRVVCVCVCDRVVCVWHCCVCVTMLCVCDSVTSRKCCVQECV